MHVPLQYAASTEHQQYKSCVIPADFVSQVQEMYFRHLYAASQPTLEQRCESWDNYVNLFRVLLQSHVNMQLPNGWCGFPT